MNILFTLLDGAAAPAGGNGGGSALIWMIIFFVVIWFLLMRPQRKKAKEEQQFRDNLQKGTKVLFSGGIHGTVESVEETTVNIKVGNGVVLTVEKSMVTPDAQPAQQQNDQKREEPKDNK